MLQHAGLWDLVQLRCESRSRCVVCVGSGRAVGYLYFSGGQIVHAVTGGIQGEGAVLEILSWTSGTWDPCERPWPAAPTVQTSWQGLFLRAAQRQDEAKRRAQTESSPLRLASAPVVVESPPPLQPPPPAAIGVPPPIGLSALVAAAEPGSAESGDVEARKQARREESGVSYLPEDFDHAVRMDARGTIVSGHGAIDEHAELAAYCCRLGDLIGELLGMGKLLAIDASLQGSERCLIFREPSGDTVVLRPRSEIELGRIRAQLNL